MATYKSFPEYASIEAFVAHLLEDDRTVFTAEDLAALSYRLRCTTHQVREQLLGWGLNLAVRESERRVRGFRTSSSDRFFGPGSSPMHGGSGFTDV